MPEAGGGQVTVTASVQASCAAKNADLSTESKGGGDRRGGEDFITETAEMDDDSRARAYEDVTYLKKAEGVKGQSSFHISQLLQLSASQPGGRKCRGGTEEDNQTRVQQRPRRKLHSHETVKVNISLQHRDVRRCNMYLCSIWKQFYMSTRKMHILKTLY